MSEHVRARFQIERPKSGALDDGDLKPRRFLEFLADTLAKLQYRRRQRPYVFASTFFLLALAVDAVAGGPATMMPARSAVVTSGRASDTASSRCTTICVV